jgi:hypothetical protein
MPALACCAAINADQPHQCRKPFDIAHVQELREQRHE